jgi:hypothetical protein
VLGSIQFNSDTGLRFDFTGGIFSLPVDIFGLALPTWATLRPRTLLPLLCIRKPVCNLWEDTYVFCLFIYQSIQSMQLCPFGLVPFALIAFPPGRSPLAVPFLSLFLRLVPLTQSFRLLALFFRLVYCRPAHVRRCVL